MENTSHPGRRAALVCLTPLSLHPFTDFGLANAFISHVNLLYLATITNRIPILPAITPEHLGKSTSFKFSEIFDLRPLEKALGIEVIQWHEIKDYEAKETDALNCWSTHMARAVLAQENLGLSVSTVWLRSFT